MLNALSRCTCFAWAQRGKRIPAQLPKTSFFQVCRAYHQSEDRWLDFGDYLTKDSSQTPGDCGDELGVPLKTLQASLDRTPEANAANLCVDGADKALLKCGKDASAMNWRSVRKLLLTTDLPESGLNDLKQKLAFQGWTVEEEKEVDVANCHKKLVFATRFPVKCETYMLGDEGLLEKLEESQRCCGVALVSLVWPDSNPPHVNWDAWEQQRRRFHAEPQLADKSLVKFSENTEVLSRTLQGEKHLAAEPRTVFDVKSRVAEAAAPPALAFFQADFVAKRDAILPKVVRALSSAAPWVEQSSLSNCILRHNLYGADGLCGAHTDYGLCTIQRGTHGGLEVEVDDVWRSAPEGWVLYAGDMLQILTNDRLKAVKHRAIAAREGQSHVFFVQPSDTDRVEPAAMYCGDLPVRKPVVYQNWHNEKKRAAFGTQAA